MVAVGNGSTDGVNWGDVASWLCEKKFTDTTHTEEKKICQRLARPKKTGEIEIYNPDLILIKSDCLASRSVTRLVLITIDNK